MLPSSPDRMPRARAEQMLILRVAIAVGAHHDTVSAVEVLSSDAALCLIAVLCGVALALLFLRLRGGTDRAVGGPLARPTSPPRAGPARFPSALTLTQLSISRT